MFLGSCSDLLHLQLFLVNVIPKLGTHLFSPPALCVTYTSCNSTPLFSSTCNRAFAISCLLFAVFVCFIFPLEPSEERSEGLTSQRDGCQKQSSHSSLTVRTCCQILSALCFPFREPLLPKSSPPSQEAVPHGEILNECLVPLLDLLKTALPH